MTDFLRTRSTLSGEFSFEQDEGSESDLAGRVEQSMRKQAMHAPKRRNEIPSSSKNVQLQLLQVRSGGSKQELVVGDRRECKIVAIGKRRDGGTRYWCLEHKADGTAKYGVQATECRYARQPPLAQDDILGLDVSRYAGGIALWGAVPPVYDTTRQPLDRGIHVHGRSSANGDKDIDKTYRGVKLRASLMDGTPAEFLISELDAIYYMATRVFGFDVKYVECTYCGYPHLDKDWFSVHTHIRHLCAGCGKNFRDTTSAIGNPVAGIQAAIGHQPHLKKAKEKLKIRQADFPGGIQVWGSNPAIVWTSAKYEEEGIHVHAFKDDASRPHPDDTFSEVEIDGVRLNAGQVRVLMAQNTLPHIAGRVQSLFCPKCKTAHFSRGEHAFTPAGEHECSKCGKKFASTGRLRNLIGNPAVDTIQRLATFAVRSPQKHSLDLLPETL